MGSLFKFAIFWAIKISMIVFPLILIIGYLVLSKEKNLHVTWLIPWILYSCSTIVIFLNNIILSFVEGCNSVSAIQKIRFYISLLNTTSVIIFLIINLNIYALSLSFIVSALGGSFIIFKKYRILILQLLNLSKNNNYPWNIKIFPLLKKYSISWISGYFIFSIFTPIAFYFFGGEISGKIGISIALWTSLSGISSIWIISILPKINILIQEKNYILLNEIFYKRLYFSIITYLFGFILIILIYLLLKSHDITLIGRFLDIYSLIIIGICWLIQLVVGILATYMRSHKQEPLVMLSLFSAFYVSITTLLSANFLEFKFFFIGFLSSYFITFPFFIKIFSRYKNGQIVTE